MITQVRRNVYSSFIYYLPRKCTYGNLIASNVEWSLENVRISSCYFYMNIGLSSSLLQN